MELIRARRVTLQICILYKPEKSVILLREFNNERELNANGTVDSVVSYQFLCTLVYYIKFPKTGCNIFNIAACLFSTFNYITPDNFPANKKDRPRFPPTVVLHLLRLVLGGG